jgi:hypothetical protein
VNLISIKKATANSGASTIRRIGSMAVALFTKRKGIEETYKNLIPNESWSLFYE